MLFEETFLVVLGTQSVPMEVVTGLHEVLVKVFLLVVEELFVELGQQSVHTKVLLVSMKVFFCGLGATCGANRGVFDGDSATCAGGGGVFYGVGALMGPSGDAVGVIGGVLAGVDATCCDGGVVFLCWWRYS